MGGLREEVPPAAAIDPHAARKQPSLSSFSFPPPALSRSPLAQRLLLTKTGTARLWQKTDSEIAVFLTYLSPFLFCILYELLLQWWLNCLLPASKWRRQLGKPLSLSLGRSASCPDPWGGKTNFSRHPTFLLPRWWRLFLASFLPSNSTSRGTHTRELSKYQVSCL